VYTSIMNASVESRLKAKAAELGFALVGIAGPELSRHTAFYRAWIERGAHGEMAYLERPDAVSRRADLHGTLPSVRSVVVVGHEYATDGRAGSVEDPAAGVIARYARGRDYHKVLDNKLRALLAWLREEERLDVQGRAYVDTGPILERELAQRAGLGWFGKNTMLIHPRRGSWFFLGCLLLDLPLLPDEPLAADHCGTCARCLEACPTGALLGRDAQGAPVMDATKCISYLTIEQRGAIPRELRARIGNRVFGCDICQEVCPFNQKFAEPAREPAFAARGPGELPIGVEPDGPRGKGAAGGRPEVRRGDPGGRGAPPQLESSPPPGAAPWHPGTLSPKLIDLMATALDEPSWELFSRGSAIRRAGRAGFARNVAVALGNWGSEAAVPVLETALRDPEPIVRHHAAWALGRIRVATAAVALAQRLNAEADDFVRDEILLALNG
jgi:epoxyqueuosine reductase